MTFSEKLQRLRKVNGLSQEQLAEKLNVSRQAISKWEMGAIPDMDNVIKISRFFDCSLDYLIIAQRNMCNYQYGGHVMKTLLKKSMFIAVSLALFTCTCLMLSACAANATSAPEIPRTSGEDQPAPMNISTQVSSDVIADENCLPGGPSDTQPEYWKIEEFEVWMEQQRDQIQKLADNKDKSFYYKDDNGSYVCREWTQEDVDSLYESWQDQLALMKEGYHFTKSMELSDGSIISGAFDPETWNAAPASAHGSTIITLPDGSTVDLGHFDTADAATKAVQEYLEQQVSSGNMTQAEADNLLDNGSIE